MRKFNITVNGKAYEVEVEEIGGAVSSSPIAASVLTTAPSAPKAAPAAPPAPKAAPAAPAAGGETISCPMPGTILAVNVKPGDVVKNGTVLFILEAMKMENEIMAPRDCKVVDVGAAKGASVNTGDLLAVIE